MAKRHEHSNKDKLDGIGESGSGILTYKGEEYVRKSDLPAIGEKDYLFARRNTSQTVAVNANLVFTDVVHRRGEIEYNTTTGIFTLKPGKAYRISVSPYFGFSAATDYAYLALWDYQTNSYRQPRSIHYALNRAAAAAPTNFLDVVVVPTGANDKFAIRHTEGTTATLSANYASFIIQEI